MQIKITVKYDLTFFSMATYQGKNKTNGGYKEKLEHSLLLVGMQNCAAIMKNSMEFLEKLKIELSYDSEISLLGIYPKELKSGSQRDISTPMFIAAQLTIAKTWKQSK